MSPTVRTILRLALVFPLLGLSGCGGEAATIAMVPSSFSGLTNEIDASIGGDINWVVAGSSRLVRQLADGAAADVLITADTETMAGAVDLGLVAGEPVAIAGNSLVVALAPGNPAGITALDDLADPTLLLGVCAAEVPCGRLAGEVQSALGFTVAVDTEEPSVRSLALKVAAGELDAGLIYTTDADDLGLATLHTAATEALTSFETEYQAASIGPDPQPLIAFLQSAEGRRLLVAEGFGVL